jgi:NADPH2:quinone reductase
MRAVVVAAPGGLDALAIEEIAEPELNSDDVVIEVVYAACNWGDVQKRQGIYPDPIAYPAVLGAEIAGRIVKRGSGIRHLRIGQPVAAITGPDMLRGFAERVRVPSTYVLPVPPDLDLRRAAAFPVAALTAWHLLHSAHRIRRGETVLVHAAAGAVGLALTQLAVAAGARVIGTVGRPDKAAWPRRCGACRAVVRGEEDFVGAAMEETAGRGVDLVIDSLGSDVLERSFDALRTYGRVINIGEAAGEPDFPIRRKLYERSTSLAGFEVLHACPGSRRWRLSVRKVVELVAAGRLNVPIADVLPMSAVREAQRLLEGRGTTGKILLDIAA